MEVFVYMIVGYDCMVIEGDWYYRLMNLLVKVFFEGDLMVSVIFWCVCYREILLLLD